MDNAQVTQGYDDMAYAKSIVETVEQGCTYEDRCLAVRDLLARHRLERSEPVAVVGNNWQLLWASGETLTATVERTGIKIGSLLYTTPPEPVAEIERLRADLNKARGILERLEMTTDRERALVEAARAFAEWADEAAKMIVTIESVNGDVHPIIRRIAEIGKPISAALSQYEEPKQ